MPHFRTVYSGEMLELMAAAEASIHQVPPAFPLTATVAVNPFLGQAGEDRATAAARLARVAGIRATRPRAQIAAEIAAGRIEDAELEAAAAAAGLAVGQLFAAAGQPAALAEAHPTVADLAARATGVDWPELIAERVGLWAAAHFDDGQALWPNPTDDPFASWRAFATHDLTPQIAGLPGFCARVAALPAAPRAAFAASCAALGLGAEEAPLYFHRLLMTLGGWAQLARTPGWIAERDDTREDTALALLTIRLVWEAALLDAHGQRLALRWETVRDDYAAPVEPDTEQRVDAALQDAADRAAERRLAALLEAEAPAPAGQARPAVQAIFCIDVRSEVFRRALETSDQGIETIGFAGFFGIATAHCGDASDVRELRGPVLIPAGQQSGGGATAERDLADRLSSRAVRAWGRFRQAAVSSFAFVEAAGALYGAKLVKGMHRDAGVPAAGPAPALSLAPAGRVDLAAGVLRALSFLGPDARPMGRLVAVMGHGARVTNAPHASALQCGACGGHAGDVNARLLAGLMNDPSVRAGLEMRGIAIPADTVFVGGLHDTTADTVTLFEDTLPASHAADIARLRRALAAAGRLARAERGALLPRADKPETLLQRGGDWAELRPEWGLAGCAAFIAAPRARTAGRDLGGRAFLHSYEWRADDGFGVLELILTAPVVVASWISLQYYGSSVAPEAFGGGNKLLHNVVGGIGVLEGTAGTLRVGLPWQSVHDGETLRHEPVRLAVVVEAPVEAISAVLEKHPSVSALFDNGWLSLHAMDDSGRLAARYEAGTWVTRPGGAADRVSTAA